MFFRSATFAAGQALPGFGGSRHFDERVCRGNKVERLQALSKSVEARKLEVEEQNRELEDSKGSEHCGLTVHIEGEAVHQLEGP